MYIALRTMKIGDEDRKPGSPIPEAYNPSVMTPSMVATLVRTNHMRDMSETEAEQYKASVSVDVRVSEIKNAQKKRRKAMAKLDVINAKIGELERELKPLRDEADGYEQKLKECKAKLKQLDAEGAPELMDRHDRRKMKLEIIAKDEAEKAKATPAKPAETKPPPEVGPSEAQLLRVRLLGHTVVQLRELAKDRGIDTKPLMKELGRQPSKDELVDFMAKTIEAMPQDKEETATGDDD